MCILHHLKARKRVKYRPTKARKCVKSSIPKARKRITIRTSISYEAKIYSELLKWKSDDNGQNALLIDGARRVGKSYIVEEFAKNEYESYILIDFNNTMQQVLDLFRNYLYDLDTFFMYLQLYFNVKLTARKSLIIFDEVQAFPEARAAIKYLVKDGRYDYLETGSLVSINKNVKTS